MRASYSLRNFCAMLTNLRTRLRCVLPLTCLWFCNLVRWSTTGRRENVSFWWCLDEHKDRKFSYPWQQIPSLVMRFSTLPQRMNDRCSIRDLIFTKHSQWKLFIDSIKGRLDRKRKLRPRCDHTKNRFASTVTLRAGINKHFISPDGRWSSASSASRTCVTKKYVIEKGNNYWLKPKVKLIDKYINLRQTH